MATRSSIAIQYQDGSVDAIYCHWDGYPTHMGKTLLQAYNDRAKAEDLIVRGDLSTIGNTFEECELNPNNDGYGSTAYNSIDDWVADMSDVGVEWFYMMQGNSISDWSDWICMPRRYTDDGIEFGDWDQLETVVKEEEERIKKFHDECAASA